MRVTALSRLFVILKKEFLQLRRDPALIRVVVIGPIVQLLLFGYVVTTDVKNIQTVVFDEDSRMESRRLIDSFDQSGFFDLTFVSDLAAVGEALDSGKAAVGLIIPPDYSEVLRRGRDSNVQVIVDGSDPNLQRAAVSYATGIIQTERRRVASGNIEKNQGQSMRDAFPPPLDVSLRVWYNPELKSVNFMIPGLIGLIISVVTVVLASAAIVREKERGTLEQIMVSPIKRWELIAGKLIPFVVIAFIDVTIILLIGIFWFGVPLKGSILLLLLASLIFIASTLGMGLLVSTLSNTQQQAMMTAFLLFMIPSFMLSGLIFPIENMPLLLQLLTYLVPLRYFLAVVRGLFLKGVGLTMLWPDYLALAVFGVVIFWLSTARFQKKLG